MKCPDWLTPYGVMMGNVALGNSSQTSIDAMKLDRIFYGWTLSTVFLHALDRDLDPELSAT